MASRLLRWVIASVSHGGVRLAARVDTVARSRRILCDAPEFTGYTIDGGCAEYVVADSRYCFRLSAGFSDIELAPWLRAGLIGYRALRKAGDARRLGIIYGFGAAAHISVRAPDPDRLRPGNGIGHDLSDDNSRQLGVSQHLLCLAPKQQRRN